MSVCYLNINVAIHGLDIESEEATNFIVDRIREAIKTVLLGDNKEMFKFRNEFENDIEVEITEHAGSYSTNIKPGESR